jgi:glycosyltransferase involved in cell wall biosynthesis
MQRSTPDVSVVVPAWGAYARGPLDEALASLQGQDLPARIVVVDNASDPPVAPRPGVDVVRSPRRLTLGGARNRGLAEVRTPYVLFWDADDLMLPGTLARLRARLEDSPHLLAVAGAIVEGEPPVPHRWPRRWAAGLARRPALFALTHCVWSIFPTTGCTLMRAAAVRDAGGFGDADSGDDWALGVSLAFRGRVALVPEPGRLYRRHRASIWQTHATARHQVRHAAAVRRRLRRDAGIPAWVGRLRPVIASAQLLAIGASRVRRRGDL